MRPAITPKGLVLILLLFCGGSPGASAQTPAFVSYSEKANQLLENTQVDEYNTLIDPKGNLFTLSYDHEDILELEGSTLKSIKANLRKKVYHLAMDSKGTLYCICDNKLYRREDGAWAQIGDDIPERFPTALQVGLDDNVYLNTDHSILKFEDGGWTFLRFSDKKAVSHPGSYFKKAIDSKGTVYMYHSDLQNPENKKKLVLRWDGKAFKSIGDMPGNVTDMAMDKDGRLYVSGFLDKDAFRKVWDGVSWTDVPAPAEALATATFMRTQHGQVFLHSTIRDTRTYVLYKLTDGKWQQWMLYPPGTMCCTLYPVSPGRLYYIGQKRLGIYNNVNNKR
ncbi:hypothetical protein [Flaviaesturariibacter amylovorans]|uniref:SMP-30/Gluconolactonase/LRE-like region domain-containing protein n=1 Tax=Flaviaesturariibacter amylovorans TaxID=1084520 RepID=A0ABP8G7Z3_9BACT